MSDTVLVDRNVLSAVYKNEPIPPLPDLNGAIVNRTDLAGAYQPNAKVKVDRIVLDGLTSITPKAFVDRLVLSGVYLNHAPIPIPSTAVNRVDLAIDYQPNPTMVIDRNVLDGLAVIDPEIRVDRLALSGVDGGTAKTRVDRVVLVVLQSTAEYAKKINKRSARHRWQKR